MPDLRRVAALYVAEDGPYVGRERVDAWPEIRDARLYAGPWSAVAHPPCQRWGRYWNGGPSAAVLRKGGDDGGCFSSALASVRKWGGVIEHPEGSHAWRAFKLPKPPRGGGWVRGICGGGSCCVEQGWYGHPARKATWLYAFGIESPPELVWGASPKGVRIDEGFHSAEERRRVIRTGACQRLSKRQRTLTPEPFVAVMLDLARLCSSPSATP